MFSIMKLPRNIARLRSSAKCCAFQTFRVSRGGTNAGVSLILFYIINPRYSEHITRAKRECNDSLSDSGNWNAVNSDNWSALSYLCDRSASVNVSAVSDIGGDTSHVLSKFIFFIRAYWYCKAISNYRFIHNIITIIIARVSRMKMHAQATFICIVYSWCVHNEESNLKTNEIYNYTAIKLFIICI
jgi:hypothetical protein